MPGRSYRRRRSRPGTERRRRVLALRLSEPLTVALAESVMVLELLTARIVVPDGTPVPVTICPATRCNVLPIPLTDADPLLSVP